MDDHEVTISDRPPYVAHCSCGWATVPMGGKGSAALAAYEHLRDARAEGEQGRMW